MTIDLTGLFRGSAAVAVGLLTRGVLRGPRYQRLFPDVHAPAALKNDLALRAGAAGVLVAAGASSPGTRRRSSSAPRVAHRTPPSTCYCPTTTAAQGCGCTAISSARTRRGGWARPR